jgi:hypothetical protein
MEATTSTETAGGARHRGPSMLAVGTVHTLLFVASVVGSIALAGGEHFPSPFQPEMLSSLYFAQHADAVRLGAFLQFGAAVPLGIFTATAVSRLRFLGVDVAAGTTIALFGGFSASTMLALSGLVSWVLSWSGIGAATSTVRALHVLSFAMGGPGCIVPLGLLIAGLSLTAGLARRVPRWLMWFGLVVAGIAELSALSLIVPAAVYLLPLARFPGLVWIICLGALLPKARAGRGGEAAKPAGSVLHPATQG